MRAARLLALVVCAVAQHSLERHHWAAHLLGDSARGKLSSGSPLRPQASRRVPGAHFVAGVFEGRATLSHKHVCSHVSCTGVPASQFVSRGRSDVYLAKYDAWNRLVWAFQAGGAGDDSVGAVAINLNTRQVHERAAPTFDHHQPRAAQASADVADATLYLTGTIQGKAQFGDWLVEAASSMSFAPFLAKVNASSGEVQWVRAIGNCTSLPHTSRGTHTAFDGVDPRTWHSDTYGECDTSGLAVDGHGSAVVMGKLMGTIKLQPTLFFQFQRRTFYGTLHARKLDSRVKYDPIELAVGFPAFEEVFTMPSKDFRFELEAEETAHSLATKISEAVQAPREWVSLLVNDGTPLPIPLQKGQPGFNEFLAYPYVTRWQLDPMHHVTQETVDKYHLMAQICNATWRPSLRETPGDKTSIQTLLDRANACDFIRDTTTGSTTWFCPSICQKHSECVGESICLNETCWAPRTYCANISVTFESNQLTTARDCSSRAASGRSCRFEPWVAKYDKDGLYRWSFLMKNVTGRATQDPTTEAAAERLYWAGRAEEQVYGSAEGDMLRMDDDFPAATAKSTDVYKYQVKNP